MKYIIAIIIILIVLFIGFTNNWNAGCLNIPNDFNDKIQWDRGDPESPVSKCDAWLKHKEEYKSIKKTTTSADQNNQISDDVNFQEKQDKNDQKIIGTEIEINAEVGEKLGEFTINEIGNCGEPFENNICGIKTTGIANVEGSFYFNSHFGEYCFIVDMSKEINKNSIINPAQDIGDNGLGFCFYEDIKEILPQQYLVQDDESFSDLVKIKIKDFRFDWRPMGVTNTATFIEIIN